MTQDLFDPVELDMHWRIVEIHYELREGPDGPTDYPTYIRTIPCKPWNPKTEPPTD